MVVTVSGRNLSRRASRSSRAGPNPGRCRSEQRGAAVDRALQHLRMRHGLAEAPWRRGAGVEPGIRMVSGCHRRLRSAARTTVGFRRAGRLSAGLKFGWNARMCNVLQLGYPLLGDADKPRGQMPWTRSRGPRKARSEQTRRRACSPQRLGMRRATGKDYRNVLELHEQATRPPTEKENRR